MERWLETLLPKLFGKEGGGASLLDPPEPLFKLALAPGMHHSHFRPLPPSYHFVKLESVKSQVAAGTYANVTFFSVSLDVLF